MKTRYRVVIYQELPHDGKRIIGEATLDILDDAMQVRKAAAKQIPAAKVEILEIVEKVIIHAEDTL